MRKSEFEWLKLSATVSSLETFRMNMSKSKCGKINVYGVNNINFNLVCLLKHHANTGKVSAGDSL